MAPNDKNVNRAPQRALFLFNDVKDSFRGNQVLVQQVKPGLVKQQNAFQQGVFITAAPQSLDQDLRRYVGTNMQHHP
jgi:hypothetical protein